jgi:peptidyl-prolyl isomerase D
VTTVPTPHLDNKHVVFGQVLSGKSIVRQIENIPTQGSDKPQKDVVVVDCGELDPNADYSEKKEPDSTGDMYEDFPEDAREHDKEFTVAEVLKFAGDLKEYGNKAFKTGNVELGLAKYQKGLRYLNEDPDTEKASEEEKTTLKQIRYTLNSNSALLANKLSQFTDAEKSATYALEVEGISAEQKAKALYRRAVAYAGLKDEESAEKDLLEAQKLVPGDAAVEKELKLVKQRQAARIAKEKAALKKFFS